MSKAKKVYWAGDLFNFKDLLGNRLLADAFNQAAQGRWIAALPQESESNAQRSSQIRDDDLENLFTSDAVVANFDGTDLDSGTVVEFCYGKFLDLPTVLLRTDFRRNGDQDTGADPWNLMCSSYPRTEVLCIHSMVELHRKSTAEFLSDLAQKIVDKLDQAAAVPRLANDFETEMAAFKRAVQSAGSSMPERFSDERIRQILEKRLDLK